MQNVPRRTYKFLIALAIAGIAGWYFTIRLVWEWIQKFSPDDAIMGGCLLLLILVSSGYLLVIKLQKSYDEDELKREKNSW